MVSDKPQLGRCGAKCHRNTGLRLRVVHEEHADSYGEACEVAEDVGEEIYDEEMAALTVAHVHDGERVTFEGDEIDEELIDMLYGPWAVATLELEDGETLRFEWDDGPYYHTGQTGAQKETVGFCEKFPMPNGRCYKHGGHGKNGLEGKANAMTHGIYADRSNYYENISEEEQAMIDMWFESFMEEAEERGLFTREDIGKVEILRGVCIDLHKKRRANEYIQDEGLVQEFPLTDSEGDPVMGPDGEPVMLADENALNLPIDRIDRTSLRKLNDLGFLDNDDEEQKAAASLASQLAKLANKATEE